MPTTCAVSVVERLRSIEQLMSELDLASVDADELPGVTNALRRVETRCAAVGVAIAQRARSAGDDPNATLLGRGRVSGTTARKESRRAEVADAMPAVGQALAGGDVSGEHLDAIAQARKGLTVAESARFDELGTNLASAAGKLPVDTFKKKLRSLVDEHRSDHGLTRLQQQRARSELRMWTADDGMRHLHIAADPERFAKIQHDRPRSQDPAHPPQANSLWAITHPDRQRTKTRNRTSIAVRAPGRVERPESPRPTYSRSRPPSARGPLA